MSTLARPGRSPTLVILGLLWAVVVTGLLVLRPGAFAVETVTTVLQFSTLLALVALGQSLVVLCGGAGIDLSVGGIASLSGVATLMASRAGMPAWLVPPVCLLLGVGLGALNGAIVTRLRILPLIATLATFYAYSGLALALTNGAAQGGVPTWLIPWGRGVVGGLPLPFLTLALPAFVVAGMVLATTEMAREIWTDGLSGFSA